MCFVLWLVPRSHCAARYYSVYFLWFRRRRVRLSQRPGGSGPPERILLLHIPTDILLTPYRTAISFKGNQNKSISLRVLSPSTIGVDVGIRVFAWIIESINVILRSVTLTNPVFKAIILKKDSQINFSQRPSIFCITVRNNICMSYVFERTSKCVLLKRINGIKKALEWKEKTNFPRWISS